MIDAAGLGPIVVAGIQSPLADHQLTVKQMQLFDVTRWRTPKPR
jgi:hypothetical protein